MSELEIPEVARNIMLRAAWPVTSPSPDRITHALTEAAKLILAAELRRLLAEANKGAYADLAQSLYLLVCARADELDLQ